MDIPEIPNVSKSAIAYLLQAAVELATEADFEPTSEAQMREWANQNSQAIAERAQELQDKLFIKFYEHRGVINEVISANIWEKMRLSDIDRQV
jgi:SOS-response transcriptional repressor LexA